ncbi:MAG: ribosome silencing factor [Hyphomicrobiales bacterium]|nr:ribosome silencing factor [Hyphomicrobiales bacterium]
MYPTINAFESRNSYQEDNLSNLVQKGSEPTASSKSSSAETNSVEDVYSLAITSLENTKAEQIQPINISEKSSIGDYMIIASGRSHRHVGAIASQLLRDLKEAGVTTPRIEGQQNGDWVLIDIGDVIVHLFRPEVRDFYNLEKMWMLPIASQSKTSEGDKPN